jgi:cytochrome c553
VDYSVVKPLCRSLTILSAVASVLSWTCSANAGDSMVGETIATQGAAKDVAACISCHGAKGEGNAAAGFPRLAGVSAAYLSAQLAAFAAGKRQNPIMEPLAKRLSIDERNAVATYFAALPPAPGIKTNDSESTKASDIGAWLATRGRWDQGLPACAQCHGPGGTGVGLTFPPLAGQPAAYIASQLHGWKNGTRPAGPMALMSAVASKLSDTDITAVAAYYAGADGLAGGSASNGSKQ